MIFADTSYFLALLNPDDQWHAAARQASAALSEPVLSSDWILVELANAMTKPPHRIRCAAFIRELHDAGMEIVPANHECLEHGLTLYQTRPDQEWSLTDCISLRIMQARGLRQALTTDRHFKQAGFRALLRPDGE